MGACVLDLTEIDQTQTADARGKGAHLGELTRIDGITVAPGYCVTDRRLPAPPRQRASNCS